MTEISVLQKSANESGSQTLACVGDVGSDLQLVARNAGEMKTAQTAMATWFGEKLEIAKRDHAELAEAVEVAKRNGWQLGALQRQARNALGRVRFFEKCKAASEAGYCIIPNLPVDVFAIRTHRNPKYKDSADEWTARRQYTSSPPLGDGEFYSDRTSVTSYDRTEKRTDGTERTITRYETDDYVEVEFPISVARPLVMTATSEAMALKCFDEIGVLPDRWITKKDPIVVGTILRPGRQPWALDRGLMFLVAWYVDTRTL